MARFQRHLVRLLILFFCLPLTTFLRADEDPKKAAAVAKRKPTQFIRIVKDENGKKPAAMQTAVVSYVPADGDADLVVDLVAVVHVGERSYYEKLNEQFKKYDVVLYELVAPKGTRIPKGGRGDPDGLLGMLQQLPQTMLGLESQLDHVDYTQENFVHADMSPQEMAAAMKKRGDTGLTVALGVLSDMMRQQNRVDAKGNGNADPFAVLENLGDPAAMKQLMAEQFTSMGALEDGLGATLNRMLIRDRNKAAMRVFEQQMKAGKKRIAIFYGAAHMPDFERRLMTEFDLRRGEATWLAAWDLKSSGKGNANSGIGALFKMLKDLE